MSTIEENSTFSLITFETIQAIPNLQIAYLEISPLNIIVGI